MIYNPLSYIFSMVEKGGSSVQQFDSVEGDYQPNRNITPYVLQPCLVVDDPDGIVQNGDVTAFMVNAVWTVSVIDNEGVEKNIAPAASTYSVDKVNGYKLTLYLNCGMSEKIILRFRADYLDQRRGDTQQFNWEKELVCDVQQQFNFSLTVDTATKTLLSPFRNREKITVNARLMNGREDVSAKAEFNWYWWTNGKYVNLQEIDDDCEDVDVFPLWYDVAYGHSLVVRQERIQDIIIKCEARLASETVSKVFRMIRWYGQWEEHLDLLGGQFILCGQTRAIADVTVATRKEVFRDPTGFFDVEIFHSTDGKKWDSVTNDPHYEIESPNLAKESHHFGCIVRELTADIPLVLPDGSPLITPDGAYVVVNVPEEK